MIVVDVQVLLSALRSRRGASNAVLGRMIEGMIEFAVSPAVAFEYEEVLKRPGVFGDRPWISEDEIDIVLDAVLAEAILVAPRFRFRPFLDDPDDDIYIEMRSGRRRADDHQRDRHFRHPAMAAFGLTVLTPAQFLAGQNRS